MIKINKKNPLRKIIIILLFFQLFLNGCSPWWIIDSPHYQATQNELDLFYSAISTNNVSICYELNPKAKKINEWLGDNSPTFELRNHCFYTIATQTKNPELCENMVYIGKEKESEIQDDDGTIIVTSKGGFETYKENCIKKASK